MNVGLTGDDVHRDPLPHNGFLKTAVATCRAPARRADHLSIVYYI